MAAWRSYFYVVKKFIILFYNISSGALKTISELSGALKGIWAYFGPFLKAEKVIFGIFN